MILLYHSWIYIQRNQSQHTKETPATPTFTAALCTVTKLWNQSRCPSTDKCIKKMWHMYTMEYHSATRKNEIMSFKGKWIEVEIIILSEISFCLLCRI
jgi:hypothetical protein